MRRIIGVVAGLLLMALALPAVAQEQTSGTGFRPVYKNPTPGEMPIMVWGGWGINDHLELTDEWASWLVDAGVNLVYGYMGDVRQKERIPFCPWCPRRSARPPLIGNMWPNR